MCYIKSGSNISYELFRLIYRAIEGEPEFRIYFADRSNEYMIIKYDDRVDFQRCGCTESKVVSFDTLDSLYNAETIDSICLKRDFGKITDIIANDCYSLSDRTDLISLFAEYNTELPQLL